MIFKRKPKTDYVEFGQKQPHWFRRHKKLAIILGFVSVLLIAGGTVTALYVVNKKPTPPPAPANVVKPVPQPVPVKYFSPLTGLQVADQAATTQAVTAVMIENSPIARPQSGLKEAGVVFEAIAEGGITRFAVLYQQEKPALIGPVRSVRTYYVDWIAAFNASIAHVGGSLAALNEVRNGSYRDIDQFFNGSYYYRSTDRYAPHNVYTTSQKLDALNASKGYTTSTFTGFTRKDSVASKTPNATQISVTISSAPYNSSYTYNSATNTYDRSVGGAPHLDREKGQISPRVVVVMTIPERTVFEDGNREQIDAIGSGKAVIFQDGTAQEVTWTKKSKTEQIAFTDASGNDVPLARGQTWLTSVPLTGGVSWQ
ncbi:MAG: DUF3048 domain-containing protein [Candidatus Microsaccharimonas sossegonensis]|uniref:DUF3048 domain-containing protein n=1 Tax=Candidatus Microsaccharimonas sossegonensis TaxID=2506948 RepID=A0A4V1J7G8_9BACT|nr:MAG: DUF3048 domain-containing protein [Candidatus Microsaccharimonas sossegonensis]